jgi:hypothetical protein
VTSRSDPAVPVGPAAPPDHPYVAEIDLERVLWYEITGICRSLSPEERLQPGYYRDPDWSVKDLVAHLGAWLAVAENQVEQIGAGTYEHREVDVDARNAEALATLREQDWETIWTQAHAARAWMYRSWLALTKRSTEADFWVRKAGAEHYGEHVGRLREWVAELVTRRRP